MKKDFIFSLILIINCLSGNLLQAQVLRPASLFCDHMVLQREQVVPVWGQASPQEDITLTFAGQTQTTQADERGKWMVRLDPLPAANEGQEMIISGKTQVVISDVLVGEVWICSGQSNMHQELTFDVSTAGSPKSSPTFSFILNTSSVDNPKEPIAILILPLPAPGATGEKVPSRSRT